MTYYSNVQKILSVQVRGEKIEYMHKAHELGTLSEINIEVNFKKDFRFSNVLFLIFQIENENIIYKI